MASIATKTARSITHVYQQLRLAELIPEAAEVFQANQITAGHAVLISRLQQDQQKEVWPRRSAKTGGQRRSTRFPFANWCSGFGKT